MNRLRSAFDPATDTIAIEVETDAPLTAGTRLAITSIVQLAPGADSDARVVERVASYHELEPLPGSAALGACRWVIAALAIGHRPKHANDGPVSAFLILPDATTALVDVTPMERTDAGDVPPPAGLADLGPSVDDPLAPLVPYPSRVEVIGGARSERSVASLSSSSPAVARSAWDAIAALAERVGRARPLGPGGAEVTATHDPHLADEEYRLVTEEASITVLAATEAGFRHAFVTLAQWLNARLPWRAAVDDRPRYRFRGLHVDLARHWFEPDVVERLIDIAAWRKLSHLHLHLTDDEAWRLPVDGIPELSSVAGVRGHALALPPMLGGGPEPYGRSYTPDEIARWVQRADELGVVLVPEVDLPAHMHAALTALPGLRDPDDRSGAKSVQFFTDNVLVPGHPGTAEFVGRLVDGVATLFPSSPVIHIGGDEVPEGAWRGSPIVADLKQRRGLSTTSDVEAAFHRDLIETIRARTGRRIGAWQEAAESGGVQPGDGYLVGWRTVDASRRLAQQGYDVVVAPGQAYYLDMAIDDDWSTAGSSWAGATSLADVCDFDPEEGWSPAELAHLVGIQACLWGEHVTDEETLHRFLFPRLDAIAERAWTGTIAGGAGSLARRSALIR